MASGNPTRLTFDGRFKFSPVFCNAGREIVYVDFEKPELYRLKRLHVATGKIEPVHQTAATFEFGPDYSADGRYFAFLRATGTLRVSVIIRNLSTETEAEVPPGTGFSGLLSPALAPDGSRVAFAYADGGRQQIYSVDSLGQGRKALTESGGLNIAPCYSPDGKQVAFSSTRDGKYDIYVMDANGGQVRRLTHSPMRDLRPRFSPDGKQIAFTSHRDGNAEIYLMNADGTGQQRLTDNPERDDYPSWHPDGRRLVFVSERDGRHDLYLIQARD
jgi:TolB protein